jgi:hypothetical protein
VRKYLRLGDLPASHHRDSRGNRLKGGCKGIGFVDNFPSHERIIRSNFEHDALLTRGEHHTVLTPVHAIDQTRKNCPGCVQALGSQQIADIRATVLVTQQVPWLYEVIPAASSACTMLASSRFAIRLEGLQALPDPSSEAGHGRRVTSRRGPP